MRQVDSDIDVVLEMFDATGAITKIAANSVKNVYRVKLQKLINGVAHVGTPTFVKSTTLSTFSYELLQASKPPLSGKFRVKCVTPDNKVTYTESIDAQAGAYTIQWRIHHDCYQMYERV